MSEKNYQEENETIPIEVISKIKNFTMKITGVETFVVSHEGLPIDFYGFSNPQLAETEAALSEDLLRASEDIITTLTNQSPHEISLLLGEDKLINIKKYKNITLSIKGKSNSINSISKIIKFYLENKKITCPYCGADLTLETYTCPHCKSTIPFIEDRCPICGADTKIKRCPSCNNLITNDGRKIKQIKIIYNKKLLITDIILGGIIGGLLGSLTGQPLAAMLGGIAGAAIMYTIGKKTLTTTKYIIE